MIGLGLLAFLAQAAAAPEPAPASAPAGKPAPLYLIDKEEGKVVCRRVADTNSRIPFRVCRTELQWEVMARENQEDLRTSRHKRL